jgi:anaerobic magnesium-protoporphyrin IX monomethyl ester cyclase
MSKILLLDLSAAYFPPTDDYRDLLKLRLKAQGVIRQRWNPALNTRGPRTYSRGLLSIAAVLEQMGHEVIYQHCGFGNEDYLFRNILSKIEIVGLTCVTPTFPMAINILTKIKHLNPDVLTVLGGSHATYLAKDIIARYGSVVDIVVRGEGEITVQEIANLRYDFKQVKGITYREASKSGHEFIRQNPDQEPCDLAQLPLPAYHLLPFPLSEYSHSIMTSRGCFYRCTHCVDGRYFAKFRHHPVQSTLEELAYIARRVPRGTLIHFSDSIFDIDKKYAKLLIENIKAANLGLSFSCDLRVGTVDAENIALTNSVQFIQYCIGLESSDSLVLARHKQGQKFQDGIRACEIIRAVNDRAFIQGYWLVGLPGTSLQSLTDEIETIRYLIRKGIVNTIGNKIFVPYPGTPVFDYSEQFGLRLRHRNWDRYLRHYQPVYDLGILTSEDLFNRFLAQERALLDSYCEILGIGVDQIDGFVPCGYAYNQFFAQLPD